jgi:antitoxin (DNA-binding transcriptional repressor) of toxin-antitoxin stability system
MWSHGRASSRLRRISLGFDVMSEAVLEIGATEFRAKCYALLRDVQARRYRKVVITRRGKPIAELTPGDFGAPDIYGCMEGSVIIPPGVDLTEPVLEDIPEAESGERQW